MDRITLRLPHDLRRRFDAAAATNGGRSVLLRRLMERAAAAPLPDVADTPHRTPTVKLTVRLADADLHPLGVAAAAAGLSRNRWVVALVRRRLHDRPQFTPVESAALVDIRRELRRIGVNLNQITRALNTAVLEGVVLDLELGQVAAFRHEISLAVLALDGAFRGNLDYWQTG